MNCLNSNIACGMIRQSTRILVNPTRSIRKQPEKIPMNFLPSMSNYAYRMTRLSARIFGEVPRPTNNKSLKIVRILKGRPNDLDPYVVDHYPPHEEYSKLVRLLRDHGLFRDEHLDFKEEMVRQNILRGKVKPKRGEGKRAKAKEII